MGISLLKSNRVLAMDIGASKLKLAEFTTAKGGIELTKCAVCAFDQETGADQAPPQVISDIIRKVMREKKIAPAPVALSVSGQSAFLRLVKLPPVTRSRVYQTVQYEAQQNVPFPIEEVVWDYQPMGSDPTELNVMLVAIKIDIVKNLTDCVEAAGLEVELVDVAPMALYNAVRFNYGELGGCTLLVDIGARSTDLIFMEEGRFFSRNLPIVGSGNIITQQLMKEFSLPFKEAEALKLTYASVAFGGAYEDYADKVISNVSKTVRSAMTRLHVEIERSINFYRAQQGGATPTQMLLAGGTSMIARTDEFFKEKLKMEVEYLNPFRNIVVNDAISAEEIGACAHLMGGVVGVGLRHALPCPLEINLLPPSIVRERTFRRKQPFLLAAAISLVLLVSCWWFYSRYMTACLKERQAKVEVIVTKLETAQSQWQAVAGKNAILKAKADELADLVRLRPRWLETLDSVHAGLLDGMWIVSLAPETKAVAMPPAPGSPGPAARSRLVSPSAVKPGRPPITHLRIRGLIFADKANDKSISLFRDRLRQSPYFTDETEITLSPLPTQDDFARECTIEIALREPL